MKLRDFDFPLPEPLIAQYPADKRDGSRLLVLNVKTGNVEHRRFFNIVEYLRRGDMLLLNKTKVLPARLTGLKPTGGRIEIVLVKNIGGKRWEILCRGGYTGKITVSGRLQADVRDGKTAELIYAGSLGDVLDEAGGMPLPPYIKRDPSDVDRERYQTVYARDKGSIAAPTAGLHFTTELLNEIEAKGVLVRHLTLHVGRGTFKPVRAEPVEEHRMEAEHFEIGRDIIDEIKGLKGRLFAVGTTTTRAIEGAASGRYFGSSGSMSPDSSDGPSDFSSTGPPANGGPPEGGRTLRGSTDMFIHPGYRFRAVGGLITNFHLPRSTPLLLAAAFAGRERLLRAYEIAISEKYRFFSYGDAMLLL